MTLTPPRRGVRSQLKLAAEVPPESEGLMSARALAIATWSLVIAVIAGAGAGIPAGLAVAADTSGQTLPILVGILSGLAAASLAGLTVVGGLHSLVPKR